MTVTSQRVYKHPGGDNKLPKRLVNKTSLASDTSVRITSETESAVRLLKQFERYIRNLGLVWVFTAVNMTAVESETASSLHNHHKWH